MYDYYFTFASVTYAQGAMRILERFGIPSQLVRTPKPIQVQGCGYSLSIGSAYYAQAAELLTQNGKNFRHVFCRFSDGTFEEVTQ